jgi:hypothetical protein
MYENFHRNPRLQIHGNNQHLGNVQYIGFNNSSNSRIQQIY